MLAVAAGMTFIRLLKGPTLPDRVIAIDLIGVLMVCLLVVTAAGHRSSRPFSTSRWSWR